jgi:NADPH:quinone reductase-like Zn-dependent oxidoreductase
VPEVNLHEVSAGVTPSEAAALALAGPVAQNQLSQAGFRAGMWVLVQGASSALGSLTAALVAHRGGRVIAASREQWKRRRLLELGASAALDPTSPDFIADVLALTGGRGVEIAIDDLGDSVVWQATLGALATRGAAVSSGAFLGGQVSVDLLRLYSRSQRILGIRTGNQTSVDELWAEVGRGFRPVLDRTFPVLHAADAHSHLEADGNLGRVVLTTGASDWPDIPVNGRTP